MESELQKAVQIMEEIIKDSSVPRNIRKAVSDALELVNKKSGDVIVNISEAIYILEEAANDINMPMHTRTQVWVTISALESYRESLKGTSPQS